LRRAAALAGCAASFVVAVALTTAIRPALLFDPEPGWAAARFAIGLAVFGASALAGIATGTAVFLWSRTRASVKPLPPLPLPRAGLAVLAAAALLLGTWARFAELSSLPRPLWVDDLSLVGPALALEGRPSDFADPVRPAPFGVPVPYGTVGVLYLELYRLSLRIFGTTVFGVRFLSAAAGVLSIATAMALGRSLLPRGGGMLAGLAVAGMRWHLILSRWAWNAIVVVPVLDAAALLAISARRRRSLALAAVAGLAVGIGAHVYLAAWIAAAALAAFLFWPHSDEAPLRRAVSAGVFLAGFLVLASPLFLVGGRTPYLRRAAAHNVAVEIRLQRSALPAFVSVQKALAAPWFLGDPSPWNDLPGRSRLGLILGIAVAAGLTRALARPREELSGFLLAHAGAAFVAAVAWGTEMQPNGYRVAYLTTVTGVAAAAGALSFLSLVAARAARAAALAAVGLFAVSGALAARDLYLRWGPMLEASEGYQGRDNLLARSALRWESYGSVSLDPDLHRVLANQLPIYYEALVRYRLAASPPAAERMPETRPARRFRLVPASAAPGPGERVVERVRDGRGEECALVLAAPVRK
jgi:hypothetical protein